MDDFKLVPPDENTIFCDIDLLNRAYNFILENYTLDDLMSYAEKQPNPFDLVESCYCDNDYSFILKLDADVLSYLMPKLNYLLQAHDKIEEYLHNDVRYQEDYVEHVDSIGNYADAICGRESGQFDCHNDIKELLKQRKSSLSADDVENELYNHFEYNHEVKGEYSNMPSGYNIASWPIYEIESQIEIPVMLEALELTSLDVRGLESILTKLSQDFCFNVGNISGLDDSFFMTIYIGKVIYFYVTEKQVLEAITNLEAENPDHVIKLNKGKN